MSTIRNISVMVRIACIAGVLIGGNVPSLADTITVDISRSGRKIMLDGFLMEWRMRDARVWGHDHAWHWDAMATPEGMAGYLRLQSAPSCSGLALNFRGPTLDRPITVELPADSALQNDFIKIDRTAADSTLTYTLEWLFPWPHEVAGNSKPFSLMIQGCCPGQDTLPVIVLRGAYHQEKLVEKRSLVGRIVMIGILAVMYVMINRKIRNRAAPGGSTRRSG